MEFKFVNKEDEKNLKSNVERMKARKLTGKAKRVNDKIGEIVKAWKEQKAKGEKIKF